MCDLPVERCAQTFRELTTKIFQEGAQRGHGIWRSVRYVARSWLSDGCYDATNLETALKQHFGEGAKMFGMRDGCIRTRVGVTATSISDASAFIFTNYNGPGKRQRGCGTSLQKMLTIHC